MRPNGRVVAANGRDLRFEPNHLFILKHSTTAMARDRKEENIAVKARNGPVFKLTFITKKVFARLCSTLVLIRIHTNTI